MEPQDNVGPLLLEFFEFYGRFLCHNDVGLGVHVQYGAWLFRRRDKGMVAYYVLMFALL